MTLYTDLRICDNWKMAYILIQLSHSGGLKLTGEMYRKEYRTGAPYILGWAVPQEWIAGESVCERDEMR